MFPVDPTGAAVSKASVILTGTSLIGAKSLETDSSGYYHFANLPPGVYAVSVKAATFSELKREGITMYDTFLLFILHSSFRDSLYRRDLGIELSPSAFDLH
jgi:Carboxypeptidase regulatory-like domain